MIKTEAIDTKHISRPKGTYTEFEELQWVSNKSIPAVGSEVEVKINGIGGGLNGVFGVLKNCILDQ